MNNVTCVKKVFRVQKKKILGENLSENFRFYLQLEYGEKIPHESFSPIFIIFKRHKSRVQMSTQLGISLKLGRFVVLKRNERTKRQLLIFILIPSI